MKIDNGGENSSNVVLSVVNNRIYINFTDINKLALVSYTPELFEIIKKARFRLSGTMEDAEKYKYPYSNEYKKGLHQIVFDYYFGEAKRKELYEKGYIIEHLDNDGYNCDISNLFVLKKIKNTYKGWNFDKEVLGAIPIIALRIYHILPNKTFQITIGFNYFFSNQDGSKVLRSIKLLYDYNYELVLQDAEQILETILTGYVDLKLWKEIYRYKDIEVDFIPDFTLSPEEIMQGPGTLVYRDNETYILLGEMGKSSVEIHSLGFKNEWDYRRK